MQHKNQTWHKGGYKPEHPSQNLMKEIVWDGDDMSITYREWDTEGKLLADRPATDADLADYPPPGFWGDDGQ